MATQIDVKTFNNCKKTKQMEHFYKQIIFQKNRFTFRVSNLFHFKCLNAKFANAAPLKLNIKYL